MRYLFVVILLLLAGGCKPSQPTTEAQALRFTTDQEHYVSEAEVLLRLNNQTDETIGYNLCSSELEQRTDQGWQHVADSTTVCTMIQHGLAPGDSTTYTKTLMQGLPESIYRFRTSVEYRDTGRQEMIVTDAFSVGT